MEISSRLKKKRIGLLYGGWSAEREISIKSALAVKKALIELGCKVIPIDIKKNCIDQLKASKIDFAFIALHGPFGEDGKIQSILELLNIPYSGSGVLASALAMNKIYTKKIFEWHKLPTAEWLSINIQKRQSNLMRRLLLWVTNSAVVVKPATEGSTIGVSIVRNKSELQKAIKLAAKYGPEILIEKYIPGRELTVGILGDRALPVVEIVTENGFYDFKAKYSKGKSKHIIPAPVPEMISIQAQQLAKKAFEALQCRAVSRVDMRLSKENKLYLLEVNTIPGMTETSLLPEAAKYIGISFTELVLEIINYSSISV